MPRISRTRALERACLQCQRRKTRCIPTGPDASCEYCQRTQKQCVFQERLPKTPLTRKNLDEAESRCRRLEALLHRRDLNAQIGASPSRLSSHDTVGTAIEIPRQNGVATQIFASATTVDASSYEWDESPHNGSLVYDPTSMHDGMASLGGKGVDSGYLGASSGRVILEGISSELSTLESPNRQAEPCNKSSTQSIPGSIADPIMYKVNMSHVQNQLVSSYFEHFNKSYPVLHERTFRAQCNARHLLTQSNTWQMLYFMVLAIGEWSARLDDQQHSIYYDAARSRFQMSSVEQGNMTSVQAFLLMSNYLQKNDRPNTAYNMMGVAHRMAVGLGIHRELKGSVGVNTLQTLQRRLIFWVLYCFESGYSITTGRPTFISDIFIDVTIPSNLEDAHCRGPQDRPTEVCYPTNVSAFIAQARLAKIANRAYDQFSDDSQCPNADEQASTMEHMLQNWQKSLPDYFFHADVPPWFKSARKIVLWKESNIRIFILLASQRRSKELHEKLSLGQRYESVATSTLCDICEFFKDGQPPTHRGLSWYVVYYVFQAVLALSVYQLAKIRMSTSQSERYHECRRTYNDSMGKAKACLDHLVQYDPIALRALRGLGQLQHAIDNAWEEIEVTDSTELPHTSSQASRNSDLTETPQDYAVAQIVPTAFDIMDMSFPGFDDVLLDEIMQNYYGPFEHEQTPL